MCAPTSCARPPGRLNARAARAPRPTSTRSRGRRSGRARPGPTPSRSQASRCCGDHIAFYPGRVDGAYLDDERVEPQPGGFYGGWVTAKITGPDQGRAGQRGLVETPRSHARRRRPTPGRTPSCSGGGWATSSAPQQERDRRLVELNAECAYEAIRTRALEGNAHSLDYPCVVARNESGHRSDLLATHGSTPPRRLPLAERIAPVREYWEIPRNPTDGLPWPRRYTRGRAGERVASVRLGAAQADNGGRCPSRRRARTAPGGGRCARQCFGNKGPTDYESSKNRSEGVDRACASSASPLPSNGVARVGDKVRDNLCRSRPLRRLGVWRGQ